MGGSRRVLGVLGGFHGLSVSFLTSVCQCFCAFWWYHSDFLAFRDVPTCFCNRGLSEFVLKCPPRAQSNLSNRPLHASYGEEVGRGGREERGEGVSRNFVVSSRVSVPVKRGSVRGGGSGCVGVGAWGRVNGLGWVGLGWVGLGWVGLGWVGLGWRWRGEARRGEARRGEGSESTVSFKCCACEVGASGGTLQQ